MNEAPGLVLAKLSCTTGAVYLLFSYVVIPYEDFLAVDLFGLYPVAFPVALCFDGLTPACKAVDVLF